VFFSYSHADREWVERLRRMMAPLLRGSGQEPRLWDDSQIQAGTRWREAIETALAQAKVALLPLGQRWKRELPLNPSKFSGQPDSDQRPVERVSWHLAIEFCQRLDSLLPAGSGMRFTLPSEARWEYACRAGTNTPLAFGETITPDLANYNGNDVYDKGHPGEYREQTTPVLSFPANPWGLQDMHGNVWEWCLDHWHGNYEGAPIDGSAWLHQNPDESGARRLLRGGSWSRNPGGCRSAVRNRNTPNLANGRVGFRVLCLPQGHSIPP
jgi:formylglycine-generating enzyme required for sulfatase activity